MQLRTLDYVILLVDDLDRSLTFYRDVLGLQLKHRAEHYAQFVTGDTRLGLHTRRAMAELLDRPLRADPAATPTFEIGFKVDDVDAVYAELTGAGAAAEVAPTTRPWGQRTAYVSDPDGHLIELAQQLGARP